MSRVARDVQHLPADAADLHAASCAAVAAYRSRGLGRPGGQVSCCVERHESTLPGQAEKDLAGFYFHIHLMRAAHVRRLCLAVFKAYGPAVQGAGDGMAMNQPGGQRAALMGAAIDHGEDMVVRGTKNGDGVMALMVHDARTQLRNVVDAADGNPFMLKAGCIHGSCHAVMVSNSRRAAACSTRSAQGSFSKEMANFSLAYSSARLAASSTTRALACSSPTRAK